MLDNAQLNNSKGEQKISKEEEKMRERDRDIDDKLLGVTDENEVIIRRQEGDDEDDKDKKKKKKKKKKKQKLSEKEKKEKEEMDKRD